jgi:hypothetical protein
VCGPFVAESHESIIYDGESIISAEGGFGMVFRRFWMEL